MMEVCRENSFVHHQEPSTDCSRSFLPQVINVKMLGVSTSILHLDLSYASLIQFPTEILSINNLSSLNLSHNKISSMDILRQPHENLGYLNLDFNFLPLNDKTFEAIGKCFPCLIRLSISHQKESETSINRTVREIVVDKKIFPNLRYLNVSYNQLMSLDCIKGNDDVMNRLILHSNGLTRMPTFVNCFGVRDLDVSNNHLSAVSLLSSIFGKLPILTSVDFSGNSTSFSLRDLPVNGSSSKTVDLIKVEPSSDFCRVSFSNCFMEESSLMPIQTCRHDIHPSTSSTTSSSSSSSNGRGCDCYHDLKQSHQPKHFISITNNTSISSPRLTTTMICSGVRVGSEEKKNLTTLLSTTFGDIRRLLLCCCQILKVNVIDPPDNFNIILCLIASLSPNEGIEVSFAAYGNDVSLLLLDTGVQFKQSGCKRHIRDLLEKAKDDTVATIFSPLVGIVVIPNQSLFLLLGINIQSVMKSSLTQRKGARKDDPFEVFLNSETTLNNKLRIFSEDIKHLPGVGHLVMAVQPSIIHSDEDNEDVQSYSSDGNGDFPEKYKSWDYILQENDRKEKVEDKIIPVVKKNSVMMSEYTLSALRVQRDYVESAKGSHSYLQLFRI